ncbi:hypothetical protein EJ06DRAFT_1008 [Trichodelitschia bisporula]|uniref:Uncharacterized protein n=1 Tax=Trichodelitschia bisporula TaxID=703511 RepID=A0A6G1I9K2_9PEZI|nr:hypothetical protein EJ06DRAFT_1008 [Trichodelitschia bisporula]
MVPPLKASTLPSAPEVNSHPGGISHSPNGSQATTQQKARSRHISPCLRYLPSPPYIPPLKPLRTSPRNLQRRFTPSQRLQVHSLRRRPTVATRSRPRACIASLERGTLFPPLCSLRYLVPSTLQREVPCYLTPQVLWLLSHGGVPCSSLFSARDAGIEMTAGSCRTAR